MKIKDAIDRADEMQPNAFSQHDKIKWLSSVESIIFRKIIVTHEGHHEHFHGFNDDTDLFKTELVAPEPWDELYVHWLIAQMALNNKEYAAYNMHIQLYDTLYEDFSKWYTRSIMPKSEQREVFW